MADAILSFQVGRKLFRLTPFKLSDRKALEKWLNDRTIYENTLRIPFPYTAKHAKERLKLTRRFEKRYGRQMSWAIRNEEGEVIGGIGRHFLYGVDAHRDEIGYWLARPYWGKRVMSAAIEVFCQYAFQRLGLLRLEATVFVNNSSSVKVLEKSGFEKEGYLKKAFKKEEQLLDGYLYARLSPALPP